MKQITFLVEVFQQESLSWTTLIHPNIAVILDNALMLSNHACFNPVSHKVKDDPLNHRGGAIMTTGLNKYFLADFWLFLYTYQPRHPAPFLNMSIMNINEKRDSGL